MLPNRALIVCDTIDEAEDLLGFLDEQGAYWGSEDYQDLCINHLERSFSAYRRESEKRLCYILEDGHRVGYCYENWFRYGKYRTNYENLDDPSWNYISVSDFISKCGGELPDQTEISLEGLL